MTNKRTGRAGVNGGPEELKIHLAAVLAKAHHQDKTAAPPVHSGFIRVRKRKLKGGHRDRRNYLAQAGELATSSRSFDLVRAVRVDGKPRHEFVLGLGSQKDWERAGRVVAFWTCALHRMARRGLTRAQRRRLAAEMVRKSARLPTIEQCESCRGGAELAAIIRAHVRSYQKRPTAPHLVTTAVTPIQNKEIISTVPIISEAAEEAA